MLVEQAASRSSEVPLIFGDFTGLTMADGAPLSLEIVATQVTANQQKVNEQFAGVNNALSLVRQEVAELTASVAGASTCNNQGPTDHEGVAYALRDPAARQKAIKEYGISWLIDAKDKQLWPTSALHDDDFLIQYLELKKSAKKHPRSSHPSSASVRADKRPKQRPKFNDFVGKADLDPKVATWSNDSLEQFTCELDGRLQEPLPAFFQQRIDNCPKSQSTGKPLLPENLLRDGRLPSGHCYYKGCDKPGHRWNLCPRLAMHVAKNPAVRNF